jgi:hypothetical protein
VYVHVGTGGLPQTCPLRFSPTTFSLMHYPSSLAPDHLIIKKPNLANFWLEADRDVRAPQWKYLTLNIVRRP